MTRKAAGKPVIAVVDDEADYRTVICSWLKARYRPLPFDSAEDLLESGEEAGGADLVITDVRMTGIDGFRLCEVLQGDPRFARTPVLLLTGVDPDDGLMTGQEAGVSAYLRKPVDRVNLLEQIEKLLDARAF